MILYHVITIYHLLNALAFHNRFYKDKDCIFLLPDFIMEVLSDNQIEQIKKNNWAKEVFLFPYKSIKRDEKNIDENVCRIVDEQLGIDVSAFDEIYVWGFHFFFTAYLINRRIRFSVGEEAASAFSQKGICADAIKRNNIHYQWAIDNNLLDYSNELIDRILINKKAQTVDNFDNRLHDFDVTKAIYESEEDFKEKIVELFYLDKSIISKMPSKAPLFLTQHFMNLDILDYDSQAELNKTFLDFFFSETAIIIKPHPNDVMDYENIFKNDFIFRMRCPLELLPIICNTDEMSLATVYSTGTKSLAPYFKEIFELNMDFRETYKEIPLFYAVLKLMNNIWNDSIGVGGFSVNLECLNKFVSCSKELNNYKYEDDYSKASLVFVGSKENEFGINDFQVFKNARMVVIFSSHVPMFLEYINSDWICIPMYISCYQEKREIFLMIREECLAEKMYGKTIDSKLKHSNESIEATVCNKEKIEMEVLAAKLRATEARLEYYVNLVNEYRRKECE